MLRLKNASRTGLLSLAFSAALPALGADLPQVPASLANLLNSELAPRVQTLSRPLAVSHWTHRSDVQIPLQGAVPANDPRFDKYMDRQLKNYFRPNPRNNDIRGGGMYLAADPVVTRRYGGRNWVLYQLEYKRGTRLLNLSTQHGDNDRLSTSLRSALAAFGCNAYSLSELLDADEVPACQAVRVAIASSPTLKASGLVYDYVASSFPNCNGPRQVAFVAWDKAAFDARRGAALIKESHASDPATIADLRLKVQGLFDTADATWGSGDPDPYPALAGQVAAQTLRRYVSQNLYGCGNYSEDR